MSLEKRIFLLLAAALLPAAALADINSTATVNAGQNFNFDSGAVVSSGGDIQFTGSQITFVGSAKGGSLAALGISGSAGFSEVMQGGQAELQALAGFATSSPIPASSITAGTGNGTIIALETNGGNSAAFLVTALSSGSISFQFITYESGTGGPPAPKITGIYNGSSVIGPGYVNSGISPSTLFAIRGSNLADPNAPVVNQDSSKGLPTNLNGATVSVSVGGQNFTPALYHALSYEIAGVLPAGTPSGTATFTVTYNGQMAQAQVQIIPSAYGIDNFEGNTAVVTDAVSYKLIAYVNGGGSPGTQASAYPGEYVTIWGTGLGSDPQDSDTTSNGQQHQISTLVQVYFGGVQSTNVTYSGEGYYPGVHIVVAQVPQGVSLGCYVPVAVITGSGASAVVSNTPTIPVAADASTECTESQYGITGTQIASLGGQASVKSGTILVGQTTSPGNNGGAPTTMDSAAAIFTETNAGGYGGNGGSVSAGACILSEPPPADVNTPQVVAIDAGTVSVKDPTGVTTTLTKISQVLGFYGAQLASGAVPATGGTFTFTGTGGSTAPFIGPFSANINFPNPIISWQNQGSLGAVTRASGVQYTWTGGAADTFVTMSGSSASAAGVSGSFTCIAPVAAGQFTVPAYVLLGLPAGTGTLSIENTSALSTFTASGLDQGIGLGFVQFQINSVYH